MQTLWPDGKFKVCALFASTLLSACAGGGDARESVPEPSASPQPSATPTGAPPVDGSQTGIPFDLLAGQFIDGRTCYREYPLPDVPAAATEPHPPLVPDTLGDSDGGFDLSGMDIAVDGETLVVTLSGAGEQTGTIFYLEWRGWFVNRANHLSATPNMVVRIANETTSVKVGDGWHTLTAEEFVVVSRSEQRVTIRFGRAAVTGATVSLPLWALRGYVTTAAGVLGDSTATSYLPSVFKTLEHAFDLTRCTAGTQEGEPELIEVSERSVHSDALTEHALRIERLAFEYVRAILGGGAWPISRLTTIVRRDSSVIVPDSQPLIERAFGALIIDVRHLTLEEPRDLQNEELMGRLVEEMLRAYFVATRPLASEFLVGAFTRALAGTIETNRIGMRFALERIARVALARGTSPAPAFGLLLGATFSQKELLDAWRAASGDAPDDLKILRGLIGHGGVAEEFWHGWTDSAAFHPSFDPSLLADDDNDGVVNFVERAFRLDPTRPDTDRDGWPDYTELVKGTDGTNMIATASVVVRDGSFGDWQDLLPNRLHEDPDPQVEGCPSSGNITFYGAIARKQEVIVAAALGGPADPQRPLTWYVNIDLLKAKRKITIKARQGERQFEVQDAESGTVLKTYENPLPSGLDALEVSLDIAALALDPHILETLDLSDPEGINVRVMAELQDTPPRFCDDTVWFKPIKTIGLTAVGP